MAKPKTLAIDYGTKRIGIAISHASLADPVTVLSNDLQLFKNIRDLIDEHGAKQVLVGLSESEMAEKTRTFADELANHIDQPIHFTDETLSSNRVESLLRQKGMKHSKRYGPIDHYAAALFLEEWLEGR